MSVFALFAVALSFIAGGFAGYFARPKIESLIQKL